MSYAKRIEDRGAKAITVTVDNQYQSNRDRNNRNRFDYGYMQTGVPGDDVRPQTPRNPAKPAMWQPHTPNLTWDYIDWVRGATSLPVILKGVMRAGGCGNRRAAGRERDHSVKPWWAATGWRDRDDRRASRCGTGRRR